MVQHKDKNVIESYKSFTEDVIEKISKQFDNTFIPRTGSMLFTNSKAESLLHFYDDKENVVDSVAVVSTMETQSDSSTHGKLSIEIRRKDSKGGIIDSEMIADRVINETALSNETTYFENAVEEAMYFANSIEEQRNNNQ